MKFFVVVLMLLPSLVLAQELKVLTWNVFMLPKPIKFSMQRERTQKITELLKTQTHDVIFLQEAFSSHFRTSVSKGLKQKYPYQYVLPRSGRLFHVMNSGVFVLSRYPFKKLGHKYYGRCAIADCFAAKGVVLMEFATPSKQKFQVAVTHMQASKKYAHVRQTQLQEIKALLDHHATQGVPQFLVGDLNIDAHKQDEYPEALRVLDMTNSPLEGPIQATSGYNVDCYNTPDDSQQTKWLDHIWLREMHSSAHVYGKNVLAFTGNIRGKACPLSDHYAVETKIKL